MIRLSVLYPKAEGATFDYDYYREKHVPLVLETWGVEGARVEIDRGLDGPYLAAGHIFFDSLEAMQAALGRPGGADLAADIPNFTTVRPVAQTSEIALG
jgi:uncharacterized protein (TIGR02118 family)